MRKDVKTGMLAGVGLAMLAAVIFSLFTDSVTVERQKRFARELQNQTDTSERAITSQNQNPANQTMPNAENPTQGPTVSPEPKLSVADKNSGEMPPFIHIVKAGQTLTSISMQYYGTADGWKRILEANADIISNANQIREGMRLLIPPPATLNIDAQD